MPPQKPGTDEALERVRGAVGCMTEKAGGNCDVKPAKRRGDEPNAMCFTVVHTGVLSPCAPHEFSELVRANACIAHCAVIEGQTKQQNIFTAKSYKGLNIVLPE